MAAAVSGAALRAAVAHGRESVVLAGAAIGPAALAAHREPLAGEAMGALRGEVEPVAHDALPKGAVGGHAAARVKMEHHEVSELMADGGAAALPGFPLQIDEVQFQNPRGAGAGRRQRAPRIKPMGKEAYGRRGEGRGPLRCQGPLDALQEAFEGRGQRRL